MIRFIDESFTTLRSAETAFDLLVKYKHLQIPETIKEKLMKKFRNVLEQYRKEVFYLGISYPVHEILYLMKIINVCMSKYKLLYYTCVVSFAI